MEGRRVAWDVDAYLARVRVGCFVCGLLSGEPGSEHDVVHRDDVGVVFLARYPVVWGHVLVAPVAHTEHVVDDVSLDDHLRLQALVHRAGRALTSVVPTERLYVLSLGSQQGNRHVHWHLVPLPPGVPYHRAADGAVRRAERLEGVPARRAAPARRLDRRGDAGVNGVTRRRPAEQSGAARCCSLRGRFASMHRLRTEETRWSIPTR